MSNGAREVFNNLERAVSDDYNQAQTLLSAQALLALIPRMAEVGDNALPTSKNFLANSLVLFGLLVRPDSGSYVTIDEGAAAFYDPTFGSGWDGDVILAVTNGLTASTLAFVANSTGGIRTDVFECRPIDTLITQEVRDIYDPATRSFNPTLVDKVRRVELEFRVRNGVPNIVEDTDWLPLAVAFVKPGDASYSDCDFYDVRPLLSERVDETGSSVRAVDHLDFGAASNYLRGQMTGRCYGFLAGGDPNVASLRRSTPVSDLAYFNSGTAPIGGNCPYVYWTPDNVGNGFSPSDDELVGLYCVFPALSSTPLPRWRRYLQGSSPREPSGPRGFLIFDAITLSNSSHQATNVRLPAHLASCLAPTASGIVAGCAWYNAGSSTIHATVMGGGWVGRPMYSVTSLGALPSVIASAIDATSPDLACTFASTSGLAHISFPPWARELRVMMKFAMQTESASPSMAYWVARDETNGVEPILLGIQTDFSEGVDVHAKSVIMGPYDIPTAISTGRTLTIRDWSSLLVSVNRTPSPTLSNSLLWVTAFKAW